jgi:hypothetical protein
LNFTITNGQVQDVPQPVHIPVDSDLREAILEEFMPDLVEQRRRDVVKPYILKPLPPPLYKEPLVLLRLF